MNDFSQLNYTPNIRRQKKRGKVHTYCTDIICFDIETTSAFIDENGNIIMYRPGMPAEYWNSLVHLSLPYIWMLSINDTVYYGREFSDFLKILDKFPAEHNYIIWVHNLAFEFQFLCNILHWKTVFAKTPHKVMKCVPKEYPYIEFRCTYFLTRLSLANWGLQIGVKKMVGDLDYNVLRTPKTPLTEKEMGYCERDVIVMYHGIETYRDKYGTLENIPLTQTGTVRREIRERLTKDHRYMLHVKHLVPHDANEYAMLQALFAGGYTHANRLYAGIVQRGLISHFDFASAYPSIMLAERFPSTPWTYTKMLDFPPDSAFENTAYIFRVKFSQLNCKTWNTYIQSSKCADIVNARYDNGRVISCDSVLLWITEQDYMTIRDSYVWENAEIVSAYKSYKDYLPRSFLEYLLELYHNKTALKGIPEKEDIYLQSKQYINSMFGMMVTAILQSDVLYDNGTWSVNGVSVHDIEKHFKAISSPDFRENRYFLSYSWGVWVTAYCRRNLWRCILKNDSMVLYADTDSIFMLGQSDFTWYNDGVSEKVKRSCECNNLDIEKTEPCDKWGKKHPIGIFDREHDCTEFITLGAKRYCYRDAADGKLHLTVSGINKAAVSELKDNIENFRDGFIFDKDGKDVKKLLTIYLLDMPDITYPDGYKSTYRYGTNLRKTGYKLSITDEYAELINYCNIALNDFPDGELNARRGRIKGVIK